MTGWLREIPDSEIVFDHDEHTVILTWRQWLALDGYDFSIPTSPSVGRVYKRDGATRARRFGFPVGQSHDYVYVVIQSAEPGYADHIPYRVLDKVGIAPDG